MDRFGNIRDCMVEKCKYLKFMKFKWALILSAILVLPMARANASIVANEGAIWLHEGRNFGTHIRTPSLVRALGRIPGLVNNGSVVIQQYAIDAYLGEDTFRSVDRYYRTKDPLVFNAIYNQMKSVYFSLLSYNEIATALAKYHVRVNPDYYGYLQPLTSTYVLRDSKILDDVITFTVASVCVKDSRFVPTNPALSHGVFMIPQCSDGQVYSVVKVSRVHYDPFCYNTLCQSPGDVQNAVTAKSLYFTVEHD